MSETQTLLGKIAALRQRLEQAQGLVNEAGSAAAALAGDDGGRLEVLRRKADAGAEHDALVDASLRPLTGDASPAKVLPAQLTARARRVVERGRELLARLRPLAEHLEPEAQPPHHPPTDPLARLYHETAAMTDSTLRMVQTFPDAPGAQLKLCEGLEAILSVVARRLGVLADALTRRRLWSGRVDTLAGLLGALATGGAADVEPFRALAEALTAEALEAAPLRFLHAPARDPARFTACHSLTVAQVVARLARHDPELRPRALEAVLAALLHDAGMVRVPVDVLAQPGPLDDAGRRAVEAHARIGADLMRRLLPEAAWLAEAASAHHERLDGTGYPGGLRDVQVSSLARLLAVCDTYAALCCPRSHRPARETRTALTDTLLLAESGALDRGHAERLLRVAFYPVGSAVELADGSVGVVVATPPGRRDLSAPARPVVALLTDAQGHPLPAPAPLDLAECESHSIVRSLTPAERREALGGAYPEWAD
ncbi:MAG TPA: HD domain-containing phosphohydrolase [Gemmataceae bacterium]|nr:HD domain-containing phosphohydrolase [Gemmataceae bacterium]